MEIMSARRGEPEPSPEERERRYVEKVKEEIRRFLEHRGIEARVLDKKNRHGETVIGIVLQEEPPY